MPALPQLELTKLFPVPSIERFNADASVGVADSSCRGGSASMVTRVFPIFVDEVELHFMMDSRLRSHKPPGSWRRRTKTLSREARFRAIRIEIFESQIARRAQRAQEGAKVRTVMTDKSIT